ncbi:PA2778 family cysteine peptidase [Kineobactrum sediminis]|uniref:PA2778 family cysteine peptidase n=1 Tax=Kineobactrum sediminis TaxID=1905677 RepID=UPI0013900B0F|nr:PA2778 family cysteine peptidase [Kineobactrum sediminis]
MPPAPDIPATELSAVPFFAQEDYQCGPAALATVLSWSGVTITTDELNRQVYLPGREGSLQLELVAASRRAQRLPFILTATPQALFTELAAGHPVLVLQNLAISALPQWHYAVVVGYDPQRQRVLLRSGTQERRWESYTRFMASWRRGAYWAMAILPPGQLPASISADSAAIEIARNEPLLAPDTTLQAWEGALARWPDHPDIVFGTANARRQADALPSAAHLYNRLLEHNPAHLAARNNFADLLLHAGCPHAAQAIIAPALATTANLPPAIAATLGSTAADITRRQTVTAAADPDSCLSLTDTAPR